MGSNVKPLTQEEYIRLMAPFLKWCNSKYPYSLHCHLASVFHYDLRMAWCGPELIGVTLFVFKKDSVKKRPYGRDGWKDFIKIVNNPRKHFKLDFNTGEIIGQRSLGATAKLLEPRPWLNVNKLISPPGSIGARTLKDKWGYMVKIDAGKVQHLTRKFDEFEFYFTGGHAFRGRYILRPYGPGFKFFSTFNTLKLERATNASKLREGKEIGGFLFIKSKDQTPYVLSNRAVQKNFISPFGFSGLPIELSNKIPKKFKYWLIKDDKRRIKIRNDLREFLKSRGFLKFLEKGQWNQINWVSA